MKDRGALRGALMCGVPIELVIENGADRTVGERADLDGVRGGGFQPAGAERSRQMQNAEAGSEALFGMGPVLQDQIAQRRRGRSDERGIPADPTDGPIGRRWLEGM